MPVLPNARHEQFAQKVASGLKPIEAYTSLGYSEANAASSSSRLAKNVNICARIVELQRASEQSSVAAVIFDKNRVLSRLDHLSRLAEKEGQFATAVRAEELIGRHRGMFIDRTDVRPWSGRLEDLDDDQLLEYKDSVARAYGIEQPAEANGNGHQA